MIIGIDGNEANLENKVGVNQYAYEILWNLYKLQDIQKLSDEYVIYLSQKPRHDLPKERAGWKYRVLPSGGKWIIRALVPYLYTGADKLDVFFTPSHYSPPIAPIPRVCSIMDLGYLRSSEQFRKYDYWQLKLWSAWSVMVCRRVIAISKATQKDIVKNYPFASKKIKVTLLSGDESVRQSKITSAQASSIKSKYKTGNNYILFLGTLKPNKNVAGLIAAWAEIQKKYPNYKLVIAGKKGWLFDSIFEEVEKLRVKKRVVFTGFIPDQDKAALISGAKLFALPSYWEGFGIDIINAYTLGVPVVVSDRGSIPEVAGYPGIYVNPENIKSIALGLEKVLSMPQKDYNRLSLKCKKHAAGFSWERTARETLEVLREI